MVSACPLNAHQRETLTRRLQEKLGRDIVVHEETDERLVVGLVITLGSLVLDGSLASKVQHAARQAQQRRESNDAH